MRPDGSIVDIVWNWAEVQPDKTAVKDVGRDISYAELIDMAESMAAYLHKKGIRRGDNVMTFLRNGYETLVIALAANRLGAAIVPCSNGYKEHEIIQRLSVTPPKIVFCGNSPQLAILEKQRGSYTIVTVGINNGGLDTFGRIVSAPASSLPPFEIDCQRDACLKVYTSGTTGEPKAAVHSYHSITRSSLAIADCMRINEHDISVSPLPLYHMFGVVVGMIIPVITGGTVVFVDRFCAKSCLEVIETCRATVIYGVPTMFLYSIREQRACAHDLSSLRTGMVAGALSSEALIREIKSVLGVDVMVAYGMTEMVVLSMTSIGDDIDIRSRTVGRAIDGVEILVVDDNGVPTAPGKDGEMIARGYPSMLGYAGAPQETQTTLNDEGWIKTGDIVVQDENGLIRICGRKKELIIRGGRNIYPGEVEKLYSDFEPVAEICVLGMPHPELGEQTVACVVGGEEQGEERLISYAKNKAIGYMAPDKVLFFPALPKFGNGKIDKPALKALAEKYFRGGI